MNEPVPPNTVQGRVQPALEKALEILQSALPWELYAKAAVVRRDGTVLAADSAAHVASSRRLVQAFDEAFGGTWRPGDAALSNDVDAGCSHVCEIAAVAPFWSPTSADPVGYFLVRVQAPDLGGWELGGYSRQAIDRWAEAARFAPARMTLEGRPRREVREMLALNSRVPRTTVRLVECVQRSLEAGAGYLETSAAADPSFLEGDPAAIFAPDRQALVPMFEAIGEGRFEGSSAILSPLEPEANYGTIRTVLTAHSDRLALELHAPEIRREPVNLTEAMTVDIAIAAMLSALGGVSISSGAILEHVDVAVPAPSIAAAGIPNPTGLGRESTGQAVFKSVVLAFSAAGLAADAETQWETYRERWLGSLFDWESAALAQSLANRIRAFELEESRS